MCIAVVCYCSSDRLGLGLEMTTNVILITCGDVSIHFLLLNHWCRWSGRWQYMAGSPVAPPQAHCSGAAKRGMEASSSPCEAGNLPNPIIQEILDPKTGDISQAWTRNFKWNRQGSWNYCCLCNRYSANAARERCYCTFIIRRRSAWSLIPVHLHFRALLQPWPTPLLINTMIIIILMYWILLFTINDSELLSIIDVKLTMC